VDTDEQVDVEIEIDPLAPLVLGEVDRAVAEIDLAAISTRGSAVRS